MKKIILFIAIISATFSCKKENQKSITKETIEQLNYVDGGFLLTKQAAVLQSKTEMYAVKIDKKAKELASKCKQYQDTEYDMVPVSVKGIVIKNPNDGWDRMLIIKEIIKVEPIKVKEEIIELK